MGDRDHGDIVDDTTLITLRELGRRAKNLHDENRLSYDQRPRDSCARRSAEGKTNGEIRRILGRSAPRGLQATPAPGLIHAGKHGPPGSRNPATRAEVERCGPAIDPTETMVAALRVDAEVYNDRYHPAVVE